MRLRALFTGLFLVLVCLSAAGDETGASPISLRDYLVSLREQGVPIIFSSDLVTDDMLVAVPDSPVDTLGELRDMLRPFGLSAEDGPSGSFLVVRAPVPVPAQTKPVVEVPIPEIVVTSSLHRLEYAQPTSHAYFDSALAERLPIMGEDVVRLTARLPGTANGGISSRSHVRGGEDNEVLFLFDGLRLYEPYHMRDFQSVGGMPMNRRESRTSMNLCCQASVMSTTRG